MNKNQIIGRYIGIILGYGFQAVVYYKGSKAIGTTGIICSKVVIKYIIKFVYIASKKHVRTDFDSETIFSDAIDATFFAD